MSLVFALPEHHIIMVCFALVGMRSLCSYHVHIPCVTSSSSHHDVIAFTHESQLPSWHMTDRPSHITGRLHTWQVDLHTWQADLCITKKCMICQIHVET